MLRKKLPEALEMVTKQSCSKWLQNNHAAYQNNNWPSQNNAEVKPAQPVGEMNIYQSNTFKKDLSWLHPSISHQQHQSELNNQLKQADFHKQ